MESPDFLKFLIHEDIYQIDEPGGHAPTEKVAPELSTKEIAEPISETPTEEKTVTPKIETPKNQILLLIKDDKHEMLSPADQEYLGKILQAVGLGLDQVDIRNLARVSVENFVAYARVISFTTESTLPFSNVEKYQFIAWQGIRVLICDPLAQVAASVDARKKLWGALKGEFAI